MGHRDIRGLRDAANTRRVVTSPPMGMYRWIALTAVITAVVAFVAGAALMASHAHEQHDSQHRSEERGRDGVVDDVPGVGDATKSVRPATDRLCQGVERVSEIPLLGTIFVVTVDGVSRGLGTGGCTP